MLVMGNAPKKSAGRPRKHQAIDPETGRSTVALHVGIDPALKDGVAEYMRARELLTGLDVKLTSVVQLALRRFLTDERKNGNFPTKEELIAKGLLPEE